MEDALVLIKKSSGRRNEKSLNPCFNGRCTRTVENRDAQNKIFRS